MSVRTMTSAVSKPLQLTLAILKPDLCLNPNNLAMVKKLILDNSFYVVRSAMTRMTREDAERFYFLHRDKFFFTRLVTFMSSGPISTHILARENAISHWRKMLGPTKVYKARHEEPRTIRGRFGLTDTRNSAHGSDSPETAKEEISFFFNDFNVEEWFRDEEPSFRLGSVEFIVDEWRHKIVKCEKIRICH